MKDETKIIGLKLPRRTADYLSLFAVYRSTTKSAIVKRLIDQWRSETEPELTVLSKMTQYYQTEWDRQKKLLEFNKSATPDEDFQQFRDEIETSLKRRKVSAGHIQKILNHLES